MRLEPDPPEESELLGTRSPLSLSSAARGRGPDHWTRDCAGLGRAGRPGLGPRGETLKGS